MPCWWTTEMLLERYGTWAGLLKMAGLAVAPGGDIVLSGILAVDAPGVVAAMAAQGFEQLAVTEERDWCCIHLRKA